MDLWEVRAEKMVDWDSGRITKVYHSAVITRKARPAFVEASLPPFADPIVAIM